MTVNIDALNKCLQIQEDIENKLLKLTAMRLTMGPVQDAVADITDAGGRIDNTLVGQVNTKLNYGLAQSLLSLDTIEADIESLTGSCLSSITGTLNNLADNAVSVGTEITNSIYTASTASELVSAFGIMTDSFFTSAFQPVAEILNKVAVMDNIAEGLGVSKVIGELDELLTCASDSSCGDLISSAAISGYSDQITTFISDYTLKDDGTIDLAHVLDTVGIGGDAATAIDTASNSLQDYTDSVTVKAKQIISSTTSNIVPSSFY